MLKLIARVISSKTMEKTYFSYSVQMQPELVMSNDLFQSAEYIE